eukprot:gene13697-15125_t
MASSYPRMSQQFMESFSVLEGVMVFLPIDLQLVKMSTTSSKFDFSLEEKVIKRAKEEAAERILQEKRLKAQEDILQVILSSSEDKDAVIATDAEEVDEDSDEADSSNIVMPIMSLSDAPILEPTQIYTKPAIQNDEGKTTKQFNLSEFEDSNVTPFELVELQTLDDIDELKSVLQPDATSRKKKDKNSNCSTNSAEQELDFSLFDFSSPKADGINSQRKTEVATASLLQGIEGNDTSAENSNCNTTMTNEPTIQSSPPTYSPPLSQSGMTGPVLDTRRYFVEKDDLNTFRPLENSSVPQPLTYQNSNLIKTNSRSLPNLADGGISISSNSVPVSPNNPAQEAVVPTSRINNIMKQFQFTRISNAEQIKQSNSLPHDVQVQDQVQVQSLDFENPTLDIPKLSRHSMAPQLTNSPQTMIQSYSQAETNIPYQAGFNRIEESKNNRPIYSSPPTHSIAQSQPLSLPIDKSTSVRYNQSQNSSLPPPTVNLSADQTKLLNQMTGMGFPSARAARAIQKFKNNEKEVIDFLVQVQQVTEKGFDAEDVELALEYNQFDSSKAVSYLELFYKWKELGFAHKKIHDALKETDRENENVFEYLTA